MHKINAAEIERLINPLEPRAPAVTIYMPTHNTSSPPHMAEDQIRFKNLFSEALKILDNRDKHNDYNREFENMCRALLEAREFWEHMNKSMLLCARPGLFQYYHLPIDSDEYVAASDHFHLAPVFGFLNDMVDYYVLSIAEQNPVLFRGNDYALTPTPVELPKSVKAALSIDEMHLKSVQFASVASPKGAQYHGHGGAKDTGDVERIQFFKIIDEIINDYTESALPLILSGVDSEIAEYRSNSRYTKILDNHIDGHHPERNIVKLHEKAKEIIYKEIVSKSHAETVGKYRQFLGQGNGLASDRIADLKDAADKGRIDTLLIGMSRQTRDTVRDNKTQVRKIVFPGKEESEVIDYIALQVVGQGGRVVNLTQDEMPDNKLVVSVNRY